MSTLQEQQQFINLVMNKLSKTELQWLDQKTNILSNPELNNKFPVFFSLATRFVSNDIPIWESEELYLMEQVYPGFTKSTWTKQELVRVILMISLKRSTNKDLLTSFFETAEMHELIAFFKGLYLLENAEEFTIIVQEGIRTNMVNVFDSFALGNPFAHTYLEEWAWNQLVLKTLFLDRPLYHIYNIDQGKNKKLADMLQDYVKERWSAFRVVSPEIWRMIDGYLREDIKILLQDRKPKGIEKEAIEYLFINSKIPSANEFWDSIGKLNLKN